VSELLSKLNHDELMGLFLGGTAIVGGLLCAITAIVGGFWHHARVLSLKHEMVSRGMSAEEIRMVVDAGSKCSIHEHRSEYST
jgi:hypothetical protein